MVSVRSYSVDKTSETWFSVGVRSSEVHSIPSYPAIAWHFFVFCLCIFCHSIAVTVVLNFCLHHLLYQGMLHFVGNDSFLRVKGDILSQLSALVCLVCLFVIAEAWLLWRRLVTRVVQLPTALLHYLVCKLRVRLSVVTHFVSRSFYSCVLRTSGFSSLLCLVS